MPGDPLTFNQFQKELRDRGVDPVHSYFLTLIYERQAQQAEAVDMMATLISQFADQLLRFAALRQEDIDSIHAIKQRVGMVGKDAGVEVHSVATKPEDYR